LIFDHDWPNKQGGSWCQKKLSIIASLTCQSMTLTSLLRRWSWTAALLSPTFGRLRWKWLMIRMDGPPHISRWGAWKSDVMTLDPFGSTTYKRILSWWY
jgi:hypothetical protein